MKISFLNFSTKIISALLVLLTQIIITRYYLLDDLATYSKLINYINIATVATGIGLNVSAVFHIRKKILSETAIFSISYSCFFLLSVLLFALLSLTDLSLYQSALIALFSLLNNMFFLHNAHAQAKMNYRLFNVQHLAYALVNVVAIVAIYSSNGTFSMLQVLLIQCIYLFLTTLLFLLRRNTWLRQSRKPGRQEVNAYFKYGGKIFTTNILGILLYSGDIILLDLYLNDDSLAIYLLAATAIKLLWIGIDSMGLVIYPHFISPDKELKPAVPLVLNRLFIIMSGVLAATFIIFLFAGRPIIRFVYGAQFPALYQLILLLIIATQGVMFYKFLSRFFAAVEQWAPVYTSLIIGIALNVAMIILLVPQWGIEGAAYASVIAYLSTGFLIAGWYFVGFRKYKVSAT